MDQHLIDTSATLLEALRKLNDLSGKTMTLFAVDSEGRMAGTVTDGDVRRALLAGAQLDTKVEAAMHRNFRALRADDIDVASLKQHRDAGLKLLPCLDADGRILSIIDLSITPTRLPLQAIIMAGGKGERLRPLTLDTPKPLLKVGGKAIIDYNVEALARCGIERIYVTVNYLADKIKAHFEQSAWSGIVDCVYESSPLGTIGSASLAPLPADGYTIVMNSDLYTTISFEEMYLHHLRQGADITIATIPYQLTVPYAILTLSDSDIERITGIEEKPSYSYFANAGIYIFSNKLLRSLPSDRRTDATDLIEQAIAQGLKVAYFPINGTWIDVGTPTDFKQADELASRAR